MDPSNDDARDDVFESLSDWASKADRRARRAEARRRFSRALTWPVRMLVKPQKAPVLIMVVVVLAGLLWMGRGLLNRFTATADERSESQPYATASHPAGVFATSSASAQPAGPFANTPAAHWAEGEAGITLPAATAVEGFSEAEVAANLTKVKSTLIAARLDRRMLVDHDPSVFLGSLAPGVRSDLSASFTAGRLLGLVTVVGPDARLSNLAPRVSGRTTFLSIKDSEQRTFLDVVTNYVWAYAFESNEVSLVHDEVHWRFYRDSDVDDDALGVWVGQSNSYTFNIDCDAVHRGLLAPPKMTTRAATVDSENPDNFYDPDHTLDIKGSCGTQR